MRLPIRVRLTFFYCALFSVSTLILEFGTYAGLRAAIQAVVDKDLHDRLLAVEDKLIKHLSRANLAKLESELGTHEILQPTRLEIREARGGMIFQGSVIRQAGLDRTPVPSQTTVSTAAGTFRILAARFRAQGADYEIRLATELSVHLRILHQLGLMMLLFSPLVLACASIAGYWVGGRALAPVSEIARAARSIGGSDLSRRVAVPGTGDELQSLAETINGMLSRIENVFRQISQFTANASHELRTPLAVIRARAEVALLRVPEDIAIHREALYAILDEAKKNSNLLDDMLSLAKADAGFATLQMYRIDLAENLRQACESIALLAREKLVALTVSLGEGPVYVWADGDHLRRLWLILLENAVKYTPAGHWIRVSLTGCEPGPVVCEIRDSGIGISPTDLPLIFERFYRADKARARSEGGAGLGLAIAHWITEAHGARLEAESTLGSGSTFRVIFSQVADAAIDALPEEAGALVHADHDIPGKHQGS